MGPPVDPVRADEAVPEAVEVVVVGGGIVGASTALALARRGVSVALCEKGHVAGEQSSRNWGWVRKGRRDPREIPLIVEALRMWERMDEAVEGDTGFRTTGVAWGCDDEADVAKYEAWIEHARPYQIDARIVTGAELDRHVPGGSKRFKAAMYCASDGRAEPGKAAPAIAAAARRLGAVVLTGCAVRGLDLNGGRVAAAVTERGRIRCNAVVLAGGAWSRRFLADLGVTLRQLKVRSSAMRTAPIAGGPEAAFWCSKGAYRRRADGGYSIANGNVNVVPLTPDSFRFFGDFLPAFRDDWRGLKLRLDGRFAREWSEARPVPLDRVSPYERCRVLDPEPDRRFNRQALDGLSEIFPAFKGAKVVQEWAGLIDVTPDAVPVISTVDALPGLVVATGFSGHGFGIGPAAGRLAADLATGSRPVVDPRDFRLSRFSDGSAPRPIAGL